MTKYIIKNCPNLGSNEEAKFFCNDTVFFCEEINNCIFKRIVEKCKETKERFSNLPDGVAFDLTALLGSNLHEEILSMLEIEECR